jgi:3-hydroxybutyryl-CoA dehydrogenase
MEIRRVCIVGAGLMGSGIVQVSAQAGYEIEMVDIKQEFIDRGMNIIKSSLERFVKKGKIKEEDMEKTLGRIHPTLDLKDATKDADYIIEAVFERVDVKVPILEQIGHICPEHTIIGSNTSTIPISLLAAATKCPDKVIGTHFMNPVPMMPGVEIIKALLTSEETLKTTLDFIKSLGKETVVVNDSPGFVSNRIMPLILNEAAKLLEDNLATIEDMDKIIRLSFGWPMGPFQLLDLVGVDTITDCLEMIYQQTGWERYKPARVLKRMTEIGYTGKKVGKGFYELFGNK